MEGVCVCVCVCVCVGAGGGVAENQQQCTPSQRGVLLLGFCYHIPANTKLSLGFTKKTKALSSKTKQEVSL